MIKKLRNQPYAPKWEQAPEWEQRGRKKKKTVTNLTGIRIYGASVEL
jgi:hypothetical protein